jgi:hypothetical protein
MTNNATGIGGERDFQHPAPSDEGSHVLTCSFICGVLHAADACRGTQGVLAVELAIDLDREGDALPFAKTKGGESLSEVELVMVEDRRTGCVGNVPARLFSENSKNPFLRLIRFRRKIRSRWKGDASPAACDHNGTVRNAVDHDVLLAMQTPPARWRACLRSGSAVGHPGRTARGRGRR